MRARWGDLPPKCGVACREGTARGKANRRKWGCDRPAEGDGWGTSCWRCLDHGRSEACPWCGGRGIVVFTRCPSFHVSLDVGFVLDAVRLDTEHGTMPVPGGILDQSHLYTVARGIVRGEWSSCEAREVRRSSES